jgi:thiamine biosynthesis lipoprotein
MRRVDRNFPAPVPSAALAGSRPVGGAAPISRRHLLGWRQRNHSVGDDAWIRVSRRAMACRVEVTLAGRDAAVIPAAQAALDVAGQIEELLSVFRADSAVSRLNVAAADAPAPVDSDDLWHLLMRCRDLHAATNGAFDVTSTPLSRVWGFLARNPRRPSAEALREALDCVGLPRVVFDQANRTVRLANGMAFNFGSIGKGYAVDRITATLRGRGVCHALVSAGGSSIAALGGRGAGWVVDVCSRRAARSPLARVRLRRCGMATSGAAEQFLEADGTRYGHVLDPRTGQPAAGILTATAIADDAATADALATAFFVGGFALARRYCNAHPRTVAILVADDGCELVEVVGTHPDAFVEAT